ncbi:MAG: MGMT family protein [Planctomycetota bacterium]
MLTELEQQIVVAISALDEGEVVTYGEIARRAGRPNAPRAVGRVLSKGLYELPWWRVVRADGTLLKTHLGKQTQLLKEEGVEVRSGRVIAAAAGCFAKSG